MKLTILFFVFVSIFVPPFFAWRIWRLDEPTRLAWLGAAAENLAVILLIFLVGRWDIAGTWTRLILAAIVTAAVAQSWRLHADRPWRIEKQRGLRFGHLVKFGTLAAYTALLAYVIAGLLPGGDTHDLAFPLEGRRFVVAQGGGNFLLNYHSSHPAQRYAADITAVDQFGFRARGVLPDDPSQYAVFGADVVSPCNGTVIRKTDGLPDLEPPKMDSKNPAGNHIVIACDGIEIELAHLRQGSVTVDTADSVAKSEHIANVGNSGNTTEPHLHVHAIDSKTERAVQLTFDGTHPFRNLVFRR